jgi:hypothetical protein
MVAAPFTMPTVGGPATPLAAERAVAATSVKATTQTPLPLGLREYYAAPIRKTDGTIDAARTLAAVKKRGGTSYGYLMYPKAGHNSAREWASLPAFLDAALGAHIGVEVFLTPPSSTSSAGHRCSGDRLAPFGGGGTYVRWMTELGRLAKTHPALVSVAMDDYGYNAWPEPRSRCNAFPPGTLTKWRATLTANAGRPLAVRPVLYLADLTGSRKTYAAIAAEAPSIIWPFYGWTTPKGSLRSQLRAIRATHPKLKGIAVMVYAGGEYRGVTPTRQMVASDTASAGRQTLPVVFYQQALS